MLVARTGYTGEDGFELYLAPDARPAPLGGARARPARTAASCPRASRAATPCASRRACRSTATSSAATSCPCRPASAASSRSRRRATSSVAPRSRQGPGGGCPGARRPRRRGPPRGPRRLRGVRRRGRGAARVGVVTSGALSPTLGHPIAMAYRRPECRRARHASSTSTCAARASRHPSSPCPSTSARLTDPHRPPHARPPAPPTSRRTHDRPDRLKYTEEHEWIAVDGDSPRSASPTTPPRSSATSCTSTCPRRAPTVTAGNVVGEIESTKSVGELYAPVDGEVVEANQAVIDSPELVNSDPFGEGWLIKVRRRRAPEAPQPRRVPRPRRRVRIHER